MSRNPCQEVRCINFTGSSATGRILAERAGRALKRPAISALTVSAASGVPIRACRRFRVLPRLLVVR